MKISIHNKVNKKKNSKGIELKIIEKKIKITCKRWIAVACDFILKAIRCERFSKGIANIKF